MENTREEQALFLLQVVAGIHNDQPSCGPRSSGRKFTPVHASVIGLLAMTPDSVCDECHAPRPAVEVMRRPFQVEWAVVVLLTGFHATGVTFGVVIAALAPRIPSGPFRTGDRAARVRRDAMMVVPELKCLRAVA
jgi:hypothetical protein